MAKVLNPTSIAAPAAAYAHGVEIPANARIIVTSGVVPTRTDGTTPIDIGDQAALVWQNISAILAEGKMSLTDVISVTTYVVAGATLRDDLSVVMRERDAALQGVLAASTLVTVPTLARPEWKMEISVIAARS